MITRQTLLSFAAAALGMGLVLCGWHLYNDHQNLHTLVNVVIQQQIQEKK